MTWGTDVTYLAATNIKGRVVPFGIKDADRTHHVCVLGKVGSGRSAFLSRMALQDIERGVGVLVLDGSGNVGPMIMERLPKNAIEHLAFVDAADAEYPFSWNIPNEFRHSARGEELWLRAFASAYGVEQSAFTDVLARWVLADPSRTLVHAWFALETPQATAAAFTEGSPDAELLRAAEQAAPDARAEFIERGKYVAKDTLVRNILGQPDGKFSLRSLANGGICIVDLSRIRVFPTRVKPLVRLFAYALRAHAADNAVPAAYFHDVLRYLSADDADALMTDRSYALTLSDTVYRESDVPLRERALKRCGSVVAFEPDESDVPLVQQLFYPYLGADELKGLDAGEACVFLTIDAVRSNPFFAASLPLQERTQTSLQDMIVGARAAYAEPRSKVEELFAKKEKPKDSGKPPPFSDAFKNIMAKRDPTNFIAPSAATQAGTAPPQPQPEKELPAPEKKDASKSSEPITTPPVPEEKKELSEDELRALLSAGPIPA